MKTRLISFWFAALILVSAGKAADGQIATSPAGPTPDQAAELAKQLSNPVSSLISVPFQANWDFGFGEADGGKFTLNIQPVVPVSISKDWNLIIRTILPVIDQWDVFGPGSGSQSGLGNTTQSFFFSPKKPGSNGIIWGVGPIGYYPTATDDLLGPDEWGLGPTFVVLKQEGGWTVGALGSQIWGVSGGDGAQKIDSLFIQPFLSYTTKTHTSFTLNTESTYDWDSAEWTIPINLMASQVLKLGKQPVSIQLGGRYYLDAPAGGPDWGLRLNFTLLYPK